jgi:hypothetical protein
MNETIRDPLKRPVPRKQALLALGVVLVLLAGFAIGQLYSGWLAFLMLAPVFVSMFVVFLRLPRETRAEVAAALERQEKRPFWRLIRIVQIGAILAIAAAAAQWLYGRL